ncbi:MAG: type II toxin-antitoxin system VapC family toxin [Gemmataceae bacterium]|nr:type II toxin-antitoxin system VapC family toxin [Gemmataceae bacterium]
MALALLDTNVLVYFAYRSAPLHKEAETLLERGLRKRGVFCIAPQNLVEFAAVVTRRRRGEPVLPAEALIRMTDTFYRSRTLTKIYPRRGTVMRAIREGNALEVYGSAWYDLFLAVTMRDAGVRAIVTENAADFRRIPFVTAYGIEEAAKNENLIGP